MIKFILAWPWRPQGRVASEVVTEIIELEGQSRYLPYWPTENTHTRWEFTAIDHFMASIHQQKSLSF